MVKSRKGPQPFAKDEHNRPDTTAESLAKLKPAFRKDGTDHRRQCARAQQRRRGDARRRAQLGGQEGPASRWAGW